MRWPNGWLPIAASEGRGLEAELHRELTPQHPLCGIPAAAVARRLDRDEVLFEHLDGSGRVAEMHLTWTGAPEQPPWPMTRTFDSIAVWAASGRR